MTCPSHQPPALTTPSGNPQYRDHCQSGFAISVILMAVALIAALGTAVLLMSKTATGENNMEANKVSGAALIAQARNLKAGVISMTANGKPINTITFDTTSGTGLFNPSTGGTEAQTPTPSLLWTGGTTWIWKVDGSGNPVVKLYNVGVSANADYVVALPYVNAFACFGANLILRNANYAPQLASSTAADWQTPATAIDLSASNSGTQGWSDGCFLDSTGNNYVFVMTVSPQ